jgi:uncharacterized DUF497 family protein
LSGRAAKARRHDSAFTRHLAPLAEPVVSGKPEMKFEWDENKNLANIEKHGVSFEVAMQAFLDQERKIRLNTKHSTGEMRYYCFGKIGERVLTVRFTVRGSKIRIIGAGYWREGRKIYEQD